MGYLDSVKRHRRVESGADRYGNPTYTETVSDLPPARFAPRSVIPSPEPGRAPVVNEPALYWKRQWPDVVASDRIEVRGSVFEVSGDPADWRGPLSGGLVVRLREAREAAD